MYIHIYIYIVIYELSSTEESKLNNMIKKHQLSLVLRQGLESALEQSHIELQNIFPNNDNKIEQSATFDKSKYDFLMEDVVADVSLTQHPTLFTVINYDDLKVHSSNVDSLFQKFSSLSQVSVIIRNKPLFKIVLHKISM